MVMFHLMEMKIHLCNRNILIYSRGRIYQQCNANFSLKFFSTVEQNFPIQSNRSADPQASEIFLQLNNSNGTLNKAATCNETVNVIGKLTAEGDFELSGTTEFRVLGSSVNLLHILQ